MRPRAGKLAQSKGSAQEVKDFGAMMVKDHATSTSSLKAAIAEGAAGPRPRPAAHHRAADQARAARSAGSNFDAIYRLQQVGAHQDALNLLKDYAINGGQCHLRGFANKTAPVVEHHLEEAQKLP